MDIEAIKCRIRGEVDARSGELNKISLNIHSNPELGFNEFKAAGWLTEYLEQNGFSVERGICGLDTAFRTRYGRGKPVVAILAEYDALPGLGHACGHNLIAACSIGAGVASRPAIDEFGGSVLVIGTPAEEMHGGKAIMAARGAFDDVDAAMIAHPGVFDVATTQTLACINLDIEFFGKAAHAAARPESGINALEAMIQSFNAINSLRQHIKDKARIHGIITDGGQAANIVPEHSAGNFIVRAEDDAYLEELKKKVLDCFVAGATASGARLEYRWDKIYYAAMRNNLTLARLFTRNMRALGRKMKIVEPKKPFGSSDMGNVSRLVPSIHPTVAIAPPEIMLHSSQFALAAASERGVRSLIDGAKALAMTVADLLADPEILAKARQEFQQGKC